MVQDRAGQGSGRAQRLQVASGEGQGRKGSSTSSRRAGTAGTRAGPLEAHLDAAVAQPLAQPARHQHERGVACNQWSAAGQSAAAHRQPVRPAGACLPPACTRRTQCDGSTQGRTCGGDAGALQLPKVCVAKIKLLAFWHRRGAALKGVHACKWWQGHRQAGQAATEVVPLDSVPGGARVPAPRRQQAGPAWRLRRRATGCTAGALVACAIFGLKHQTHWPAGGCNDRSICCCGSGCRPPCRGGGAGAQPTTRCAAAVF